MLSGRSPKAPAVGPEEAGMSRLRSRPVLWINAGLAAVLVFAAAIAFVVLCSSPGAAASTARTTAVRTGTP